MYYPEYIFFFNLTKMCTQIKPTAASVDGNIFVMPEGQMRQAVYYEDICKFWQKSPKFDFNIL